MINILHLIHDDKFFDFVLSDFERYSEVKNRFVVFSEVPIETFTYIKHYDKVEVVLLNSSLYQELLTATEIDLIILHSFGIEWNKNFLRELKLKPIVYWISWGYDYVYQVQSPLLKPRTQELSHQLFEIEPKAIKKNTVLRNVFTRYIKREYRYLRQYSQRQKEKQYIKNLYSKIDFCTCVLPNEYTLLKKIPGFKAKYLQYIMGFENNPFTSINFIETLGNAIWIGNSYTLSNNHLDVFYRLKEIAVNNEIIVPLSYGLNPVEYPQLIEIGNEFFGDRFIPIVDFMPFEEYNVLLKKSKIAIFNHLRQQAVGNVIMMLWQGAKVFLSELSPVYSFFKHKGAVLFSVENELTVENIEISLTTDQIQLNRKIIFQIYSKQAIDNTNKETVEFLIQQVKITKRK